MVEVQATPPYDSPAVEKWHEEYVPIANALLNVPRLSQETIDANPEFMAKVHDARDAVDQLLADPDFPVQLVHPQAVYKIAYDLYMQDADEYPARPSDDVRQWVVGMLHRPPQELVAEHAHAKSRLDRSDERVELARTKAEGPGDFWGQTVLAAKRFRRFWGAGWEMKAVDQNLKGYAAHYRNQLLAIRRDNPAAQKILEIAGVIKPPQDEDTTGAEGAEVVELGTKR